MPYLNVKICAASSQELSAEIALVLTDLTTELLKKKRELTAVTVEYIAAEQWFIGGTPIADQLVSSFYLDIRVTEGTNTKDEKAIYVSRVFAAIEAIIGSLAPASYIVIHEIHADAWGYQGQTQEFRYIRGKAL
ncbi:MAG: tautomerase family protein [Candidatus Competibacteraceae bacterium]|nr:tautomerase family protein [Candidatus Competibacteraceae bacterium]